MNTVVTRFEDAIDAHQFAQELEWRGYNVASGPQTTSPLAPSRTSDVIVATACLEMFWFGA
jgi:hypothetical protein